MLERAKEALGLEKLAEISRWLGERSSYLSDELGRGRVLKTRELRLIAAETGRRIEWLKHGTGEPWQDTPQLIELLRIARDLPADQQQALLDVARAFDGRDPEILDILLKWAQILERDRPPRPHGSHAGDPPRDGQPHETDSARD